MIIELRERVEAADKKKIEEKTDALMRLSAPVRQKLIISYLHDKAYDPRNGKPHYMILAAAQAMLKKHGSLYIGDLFPYRAKRAFFTKMGGTKQIWDAFVQNNALDPGVPETEEHILYKYTQCYNRNETKPDKKTGLIFTKRFPDNYWVQGLRSGWQSGTDEERNSGDKWTKTMTDADGIRDYMIGKFKGGEYSHGLGCIKNYYGKCSNSLDGNSIPFIVAMSDMPSVVFNQNLNELNNTFWSGFPYPGLAFIANPG
jgi:hypothetical protein